MSNLHRDLDEFNLHNPRGFNPATPNTFATKSEQGSSYYEERMQLPKVINIVDGNLPAPSTADLDAFIIIDGGGGVLDLSWGPSSFNDWVRFNGGVPYRISPLAGYLAYNENGSQWKEFDGSNWVDFGGGVGGATEVGGATGSIQQIGATASGVNSIAIGLSSVAAASSAVVVGAGASSIISASNGVALGVQAKMNGAFGFSAGYLADVTSGGSYGIALGASALVNGGNGIAIGNNPTAGSNGTAIGANANASTTGSLALGTNMSSTATYALMIGGSSGLRTNSIANSLEVNFNEATSTVRIGKTVDSWINTSANLGIGLTAPTAKLHVQGSGSTSGTTALLVQNSLSTNLLEVKDDGSAAFNGNLGLFGTTPIAQPTTAGGSALLSTGAGTGLTDLDTFDGYTLQQVVKALRDLGILA